VAQRVVVAEVRKGARMAVDAVEARVTETVAKTMSVDAVVVVDAAVVCHSVEAKVEAASLLDHHLLWAEKVVWAA